MLGKPLVLGRPTNLDGSTATAYCVCSRGGWGLFGQFSKKTPGYCHSPGVVGGGFVRKL